MQRRPLLTIQDAAEQSGLSAPTAQQALEQMAGLGITRELTGGWHRTTCLYEPYMDILKCGTEPL